MLQRILPPWTELAYAARRLVAGRLFAFHGAQKLLGWFRSGPGPEALSQLWAGGVTFSVDAARGAEQA